MTSDEIRQRLRQRPFQPFTVYLVDGRVYKVRLPEHAAIGQSVMAIGVMPPNEPYAEIPAHADVVYMHEIARLEQGVFPAPAASP